MGNFLSNLVSTIGRDVGSVYKNMTNSQPAQQAQPAPQAIAPLSGAPLPAPQVPRAIPIQRGDTSVVNGHQFYWTTPDTQLNQIHTPYHILQGLVFNNNRQAVGTPVPMPQVLNPRGLDVYSNGTGNFWQEDTQGNKYPYVPIKNYFTSPNTPSRVGGIDSPIIQNNPYSRTINAQPQYLGAPTPPIVSQT